MRHPFAVVVNLAWAVWFGGMVMLFIALGSIFAPPVNREVAGDFAARLFPNFERLQLICAAVCLVGSAGWWLASRSRVKMVLFTLFALATLAGVVETTSITPRIETMRVEGRRGTPEFDRMHHLSSKVYMSGAAVLLVAALLLPGAIRSDAVSGPPVPRTSERTAPA